MTSPQVFRTRFGRHDPQQGLRGARDAVSVGVNLGVRITSFVNRAVIPVTVMPQIHGLRVGRPPPAVEVGLGGRCRCGLQRSGTGLPEVAHGDRQPPCRFTQGHDTRSAPAVLGIDPAEARALAFSHHGVIAGVLQQLYVVPDGQQAPVCRRIHRLAPQLALLRGRRIMTFVGRHPHRLVPQALASLADNTHMPIMDAVVHQHVCLEAETRNEIPLRIAIEHEAVHDLDRIAAGIEDETRGERQAESTVCTPAIPALQLDHGAHRSRLFDHEVLDDTGERLAFSNRGPGFIATMLQHAGQFHATHHRAAFTNDLLDHVAAAIPDFNRHHPGIDLADNLDARQPNTHR